MSANTSPPAPFPIAVHASPASAATASATTGRAARQIDPRGHRFGAATSAVLLALGFVADAPIVIPAVGLALGVSAYFGTRYSILGRPWPFVRRTLRLGPPAELESEVPPRFAQALGTVGLALATVALVAGVAGAGSIATGAAWVLAGAVGGLQVVLAVTGYCLGCRLYGLRWYAPRLFDRIVGTSAGEAFG
jgi:hypothetical protein